MCTTQTSMELLTQTIHLLRGRGQNVHWTAICPANQSQRDGPHQAPSPGTNPPPRAGPGGGRDQTNALFTEAGRCPGGSGSQLDHGVGGGSGPVAGRGLQGWGCPSSGHPRRAPQRVNPLGELVPLRRWRRAGGAGGVQLPNATFRHRDGTAGFEADHPHHISEPSCHSLGHHTRGLCSQPTASLLEAAAGALDQDVTIGSKIHEFKPRGFQLLMHPSRAKYSIF